MPPGALALVLTAALAHASWNVIAHGASRSGLPFLWGGAVVSTALWAVLIPVTGGIPLEQLQGFLLGIGVSAVLHVAYMLVLQRGYALGNLSTVYATARGTGPLLTVLVAVVLFSERPSALALGGVAVVIAGVVALGLVDRPDSAVVRRGPDPAVLAGLVTGVTIALYTLWDTFAVRTWSIPPVAFMVGCTLLEVPVYTVLLGRRLPGAVRMLRERWRTLLAFGILSPLSYILVLTAVQLAPVALVAPLREVSVVLVSLFGVLVLREGRPAWRIAAAAAVVAGIVLIAV
jgi:drug/metabolite transporter (DMT)-like permease